ncbi:MAG TPA: DUF481 domain-containing protein [Ignavibacteria bacterium]|nr:DUF481 domain-containing protein [Ignavibacteria bacterium]HMQ99644.1 DUF481 domain-containing protein [Ignavibacteria bacterium]
MRSILFLLILLTSSAVMAQVVNIESRRMRSDTTGWIGTAEASFQFSKSVDEIFDLGALIHLQFKGKNDLWLFLNEMRIIKGAGTQFVNSGFAHVRYNRKITKEFLRWEFFTQYQYNKALEVGQRVLAGSGPRFKLYDSDKFRAYIASLYMFEYQESVDKLIIERNHRTSSYLSFTFDFDRVEFINTIYFQPNMQDLKDYRVLSQSDLLFKIFENLKFKTGFNYRFDTRPFPGVPKTTYYLVNGLSFEF